MLLIIDNDNRRLCQDNRWRNFAGFGSVKSCVKTYRSLSAAKRKAKAMKGYVIELPEDATIEASGRVYREVPTSPGFERIETIDIKSLIIED